MRFIIGYTSCAPLVPYSRQLIRWRFHSNVSICDLVIRTKLSNSRFDRCFNQENSPNETYSREFDAMVAKRVIRFTRLRIELKSIRHLSVIVALSVSHYFVFSFKRKREREREGEMYLISGFYSRNIGNFCSLSEIEW